VAQRGIAFVVARLAGIAAAKRTSELIPLCHTIPLDRVEVELVALRWGKMRLSSPRWLRLTRRFPVAPLPLGVSIVEAKRIGRGVAFRLAVASVSRDIDAALVREAILRRLPIPLG